MAAQWQIPAFASTIVCANLGFLCVSLLGSSRTAAMAGILIGGCTVAVFGWALLPDNVGKMVFFLIFVFTSDYSIAGAELYFITDSSQEFLDGPHLSKSFYGLAWLGGEMAFGGLGAYLFSTVSKGWTYRGFYMVTSCLKLVAIVPTLFFYLRWNLSLGVPNWLMAIIARACWCCVFGLQQMTVYVAFTFLCPAGMEATVYGLLMGTRNLAVQLSCAAGSLVLLALGVNPNGSPHESEQFQNMWIAAACLPVAHLIMATALQWCLPKDEIMTSLVSNGQDGKPEEA